MTKGESFSPYFPLLKPSYAPGTEEYDLLAPVAAGLNRLFAGCNARIMYEISDSRYWTRHRQFHPHRKKR